MKNLFIASALLLLLSIKASALHPITWKGRFSAGATLIDSFQRIENSQGTTNDGSQEVGNGNNFQSNANYQHYLLSLEPVLLINDSATFFGQISSGDNLTQTGNRQGAISNQAAAAIYPQHGISEDNSLYIGEAYAELYADTATYVIGRHSFNFGLGAIYNNGKSDLRSRHASLRDGISAKFKIGNFHLTPFWGKISAGNSLTKSTRTKEYGVSLIYDNIERDMAIGVLYSKKQSGWNAQDYTVGSSTLGATDIKMIDIYFEKSFGKFDFAIELPLLSGEIGNIYDNGTVAKYKARALVLESNYKINDAWSVGFDAGRVRGDGGEEGGTFEAMYLHPNYQISNLLFKYNLNAVGDANQSIYDSYISNVNYYRLRAQYKVRKWTWDAALLYATADQAAKASDSSAYNHSNYTNFAPAFDQDDSYGIEIDMGFVYKWNQAVSIGSNFGYLLSGDYFSFTNTATPNESKNSYIAQLYTTLEF